MNIQKTKVVAVTLGVAALLTLVITIYIKPAKASPYDSQINALKQQISENQSSANQKHSEADTLQNKLAQITSELNASQAALNLTNVQVAQTNAQIDAANKDLEHQKTILKENLRTIYKQGEVSPIEVVASSKDLSDFVAQQQYLSAIKKKIDDNLKKIDQLKKELEVKKSDLVSLQTNQQAQANNISTKKSEQAGLLAQTRGEEAKYQQQVAQNKQSLQSVYAAKAASDAANNVGVSVGGSAYPWSSPVTFTTESDPWGFYKRQCVSYVAWKRRQVNHAPYPNYWGSAYQWLAYANSSVPQAGAIAVWGQYVGGTGDAGHVAYVENVNGDGTMNVSEFNWHPYQYTYRTHVPTNGLKFIY